MVQSVIHHGTIPQTIPNTQQSDNPKHRTDALIYQQGDSADGHKLRFDTTQQSDRQQSLHIIGKQCDQLRTFIEIVGRGKPISGIHQSQQQKSRQCTCRSTQHNLTSSANRKTLTERNDDNDKNQRQCHSGKHRMKRTMTSQRRQRISLRIANILQRKHHIKQHRKHHCARIEQHAQRCGNTASAIQTPCDQQQHHRRHQRHQPVSGHGESHHTILRETVGMRGTVEAIQHLFRVEFRGTCQQAEHGEQSE